MKKFLLLIFLIFFTLILQAQKDTTVIAMGQRYQPEPAGLRIQIYPVPVRNDSFSIKTDRDISLVKVTNIIGQDIYRIKYNNPQQLIRVPLDAPQRGMYLVTIVFSDGLRVVKKIMIEDSK